MDFNKPPKIQNQKYPSVGAMIVWKNKAYLIFLFILTLIYIGNVQYTEHRIRRSQILEKEISQLKWRYWTMQSGMIYEGMEEQVGKKVSDKDLQIKNQAPKVLIEKE